VGDVPDRGDGSESLGRTHRVRQRGVVLLARIKVERCDHKALAHEIGHPLGFTHRVNPSELMFPTADHGAIPPELIGAYEAARGAQRGE
jgi:hypothetical protein